MESSLPICYIKPELQFHLQILDFLCIYSKVNAPFSLDTAAHICLMSYLQAYTAVFLNSKHAFVGTLSQQVAGKIFH